MGNYDHFNDVELLERFVKLDDDYVTFFLVPGLEGKSVDFQKSKSHAVKIDKIITECNERSLMVGEGLTPKALETIREDKRFFRFEVMSNKPIAEYVEEIFEKHNISKAYATLMCWAQ